MADPLDPRNLSHDPERIERLIAGVLKRQPLRTAPASLQQRVLAEIERRATAPWWQRNFLHWPAPARVLFLLVLLGVVKLALSGLMLAIARIHSAPVVTTLARPFSWAETFADLLSKTVSLAGLLLQAVPSHWLYIGIGIALTLYFALLALGTTAYRALYVNK